MRQPGALKGKILFKDRPAKSLARCFAFGAGAFITALAIGEALNLAMALGARRLDQPLCDGDFRDMECIEDDGFITCHFSGPIGDLK